jgi:hypothetical protein
MSNRKIVEEYYSDINNLTELFSKLVASYRLLIGGAAELNQIALAHKNEVKKALKLVNETGDVISNVLEGLEDSAVSYTDYCKLKSVYMKGKFQAEYIQTEIDFELKLDNDPKSK